MFIFFIERRQTVWHCEKKCTSNVIANDAPKCELCPRTMKECVPLRDVSEHVKLIVYPLEMVQTPRRLGTMHQKFDVILRGWLAFCVKIYKKFLHLCSLLVLQMTWPISM